MNEFIILEAHYDNAWAYVCDRDRALREIRRFVKDYNLSRRDKRILISVVRGESNYATIETYSHNFAISTKRNIDIEVPYEK